MATLEVHDGAGRVRRVDITRDQAVLFGSSPKCDIVLDDPDALPIHGRLRWKRDRFKVDASPEAEFVELNGRRMASASFRQGDEIQVGGCRIFLIRADEDLPEKAGQPRGDRPRNRPAPAPAPGQPETRDRPAAGRPAPAFEDFAYPAPDEAAGAPLPPFLQGTEPAPRGPDARDQEPFIRNDFELELLPDEEEEDEDEPPIAPLSLAPLTPLPPRPRPEAAGGSPEVPLPRQWTRRSGRAPGRGGPRRGDEPPPASEEVETVLPGSRAAGVEATGWGSNVPSGARAPRLATGWGGLIRALRSEDRAPGQERILSSPLVVGLVIALFVLILLSASLWGIIQRTVASRLYNQAVENLNEGDYRSAIRRCDEFVARFPGDARAGKARVFRALANVRQFTTGAGPSWTNALEAERAMVATVAREPSYRDASTELAELVLQTAGSLADQARVSADARQLAEAEGAVALHARVAGKAAGSFLARSRVPGKLSSARASVRKAAIRARALAAMDAALKADSSSGVYAARDALIAQYGDLAEDRDLLARLGAANALIRRAVTVDATRRPAETEPRADPLGPPTTLVLRSPPSAGGVGRPPAEGAIVFALADGFAYGLDATGGAPLWQLPVGLSAPFPPRPIPGGSTVLVVDARFDDLLRVDARTGRLVWRQAIGEPIGGPPLVLGNQIIQPTPGGKLLLIDVETGELRATVNLGMPLRLTPVGDEAGQFLYVLADKDCLFVVARDPLACVAVEYLGHAAGAVAAPPARLGRFFVVAENQTLTDSRWRVFVIDEGGTKLRPVQQLAVPGWTWSTPASTGSVVWSTGDRGSLAAYAVGGYEEATPLRPLASTSPEPESSGPAFALAHSEREVWVASGRSARLLLDPEKGKIAPAWTLGEAGPALAPPQPAGDLVVLSQQYTEGPGVALWGVEPGSGSVRWRTVLGTPWRVEPAVDPAGDALTTLAEDGRALVLTGDRIAAGGFVEVALPKPAAPRLPAGALGRLESGGLTVLVPGGPADHLLVRTGSGGDEFHRLELPAPLGAPPLIWGGDLLVPGSDGRVDLLDPRTGAPRAEPLIAPFDRARPIRWRAPVALDGDAVALADDTGRVRRLVRAPGAIPRLIVGSEANLGADLIADPLGTGGALILLTADRRIRALSARDLSPIGAWPLEAPLATSPSTVAGLGFLADSAGNVHAFDHDGQRLWSTTLRAGAAFGPPAVAGRTAWFLDSAGTLQGHALADGAPLDRVDLDIVPASGPRALGTRLVVPAGLGMLRTLKVDP